MPQLTLEFSANVIEKNNLVSLFQECHTLLANELPTHIDGCKSRAIECDIFCVGNNDPRNAFVHVALKVMPGREFAVLKNVADHLMDLFKIHFAESFKQLNLQVTLEIMELQKTYFKIERV